MELEALIETLLEQLDGERRLSTLTAEVAENLARRISTSLRGMRSGLPYDSEIGRDLDAVIQYCGELVACTSGMREDLDCLMRGNDWDMADEIDPSEEMPEETGETSPSRVRATH